MPKKPPTVAESRHLERVKELPCGLTGVPGPSYAHHIRTGQGMSQRAGHYLAIPLSYDAHQGGNGIHGDRSLWKVYKKTELDVLDETIAKLMV